MRHKTVQEHHSRAPSAPGVPLEAPRVAKLMISVGGRWQAIRDVLGAELISSAR